MGFKRTLPAAIAASAALLTAGFAPATYAGMLGQVTGNGESGIYVSDGASWARVAESTEVATAIDIADDLEVVDGVMQPKPGRGDAGFGYGSSSQTFVKTLAADFDNTRAGASVQHNGVAWQNQLSYVDETSGKTFNLLAGFAGAPTTTALLSNGNTSTDFLTGATNADYTSSVDLGSPKVIQRLEFWDYAEVARDVQAWSIFGSPDNISWGSAVASGGGQHGGVGGHYTLDFANASAFRYWKIVLNAGQVGQNPVFREIRLSSAVYASSNNIVDTLNLMPGALSVSPASIVLRQQNNEIITSDAVINLFYTTDNFATVHGPYTLTQWKALSPTLFANLTTLKIGSQLINGQTLKSVAISTQSTKVLVLKSGQVIIDINGAQSALVTAAQVAATVAATMVPSVHRLTGSTALASTDKVVRVSGSAPVALTLPDLTTCNEGQQLTVMGRNAGAYNVTLAPVAGQTVDPSAGQTNAYVLNADKDTVTLMANVSDLAWEYVA